MFPERKTNSDVFLVLIWLLGQNCHSVQRFYSKQRGVGGKTDKSDGEEGSIQTTSLCYD